MKYNAGQHFEDAEQKQRRTLSNGGRILIADFEKGSAKKKSLTNDEAFEKLQPGTGNAAGIRQATTADANKETAETQNRLSLTLQRHKSIGAFAVAALLVGAIAFAYYSLCSKCFECRRQKNNRRTAAKTHQQCEPQRDLRNRDCRFVDYQTQFHERLHRSTFERNAKIRGHSARSR